MKIASNDVQTVCNCQIGFANGIWANYQIQTVIICSIVKQKKGENIFLTFKRYKRVLFTITNFLVVLM